MRKTVIILLVCLAWFVCEASAQETFPPASTPTIRGIDVSDWQGDIDFTQAAQSGIRIVYIRASEGANFVDSKFRQNYAGAKAAGLDVGFYHFLTALTPEESRAQAEFFVNTISDTPPDCLPAMDYEVGQDLSDEAFNAVAGAFLSTVRERTGTGVLIYSDASGARDRYSAALAAEYQLWVANYGVTLPEANGKWESWVGFQYSDRGNVPGITGNVDLDQYTREVYITLPTPTPTPTPSPTPNPTESSMRYTVVQRGQTYEDIALRYGIQASDLRTANFRPDQSPITGQVIRIPGGASPASRNFTSVYIAPHNTTPYYVARHFGLSLSEVLASNTLPDDTRIFAGQAVYLPPITGRQALVSSPDTLLDFTYVVQPCDTIMSVSSTFGLSAQNLASWNGLTPGSTLYHGQILHLSAFGIDDIRGFYGAYIVRRGDTLSSIARRFGTTIDALYDGNEIRNKNLLVVGQVLVIPRE